MVEADVYAKAVQAIVSATFAAIVIGAGRRRTLNLFLGGFLLLIAGNQAAETARSLATEREDIVRAFRVATVFAALDPLLLYYFASLSPERNALNAPGRLGLVLGVTAVFAAGAPLALPFEFHDRSSNVYLAALGVWTLLVYSVVLRRFYLLARSEGATTAAMTFAALCLVTMPAWARGAGTLTTVVLTGHTFAMPSSLLAAAVVPVGGVLLLTPGWSRAPPAVRGIVRGGILAGLALVGAFLVVDVVGLLSPGREVATAIRSVGRAAVPVRWLAFGALVSIAVIRHDLLSMTLRWRRRAARAVIGLFILVAVVVSFQIAEALVGWPPPGAWGPEAVVLLAAVVLSQGFRRVVDAAALALYGLPPPADPTAAHAAYRRAVGAASTEGRSPLTDRHLQQMRDDLGIDHATARLLERTAEVDQDAPLEAGHLVAGRYRVLAALGRGGQGRAWLAADELVSRRIVLKEMGHDGAAAAVAEAKAAGALRHPNVITIHDVIQRRRSTLLVLEHLEDGSLADRLDRGPLPPAEGARILEQVLSGMSAVHAHGIVHRDLKPQNVLLAPGRAVIGDFGTARASEATTIDAATSGFVGTPGFMAPEQRRGENATPATDVYALGRLARLLLPEPPPALDAVLARATQEDPLSRFPDATAFLAAARPHLSAIAPVDKQ